MSRELSAAEAALATRAVFAHFRWQGWLEPGHTPEAGFRRVLELADKYAINPRIFTDDELCRLALPGWTAGQITIDPAWVRALQAEPKLWLRARAGKAERLAFDLMDAIPGPLPGSFRYAGPEDLFRTAAFQAGDFEIQDIASQAVGLIANPQPGETWWDACAGEGGKTLHLSELMANKGLIWASDRADWRLQRLKLRAKRAGCFNYRAVPWDGGVKPPSKTKFDGILVDAPCSGLGTWQRNPHARWTTGPIDVAELAEAQARLLHHVAPSGKPGSRLIYSVCTLTRAETTAVADQFTANHPDWQPLPLKNPFQPVAPPASQLWLWPQVTGGNGMFVAGWVKTTGQGA